MACIFFSIVTCRRVSEVLLLILCKKNGATSTGYLSKASMTGISQEKQPRFDSRLLRSSCWWATKGLDPGIRSQTLSWRQSWQIRVPQGSAAFEGSWATAPSFVGFGERWRTPKKHRFVRLEKKCFPLLLLFQQKTHLRDFKFWVRTLMQAWALF